ncbi:MAG: orotidine-5'-phosphate decarboxylase [Firmicutes bacterium]|nr:orotidine-5'-phosphate decarboxylase [Bacillota bacterium]
MIDLLIEHIQEKKNPTVMGLDPRMDLIPEAVRMKAYEQYGQTPRGAAEALFLFNEALIEATFDLLPAVKPQIAMYERYGIFGVEAYYRTVLHAHKRGLLVIGDVKRGDIASTAAGYSNGHLGAAPVEDHRYMMFDEDMITLNPYLGYDSIEPYFADMKEFDKAVFVLVKTSNPGSGQIQDMLVGDEKIPLYEHVGRLVEEWGEPTRGWFGYSEIGAVVGATYPEQGSELRQKMPHTFFLVPGYGAQGATAKDVARCFDKNGYGAVVNSSRGLIGAWKNKKYADYGEEHFAEAARAAVIDMKNDLNSVL